jgi:glycine cleavage system H protein
MAEIAKDRHYTKDHEWVLKDATEKDLVTLGISDFAQDALGDIVMVELPEVGDTVSQGEPYGSVESPKSVSDVFSPVSGEVVAVNEALEDAPEQVNDEPFGEGWLIRVRMSGLAYGAFCDAQDG